MGHYKNLEIEKQEKERTALEKREQKKADNERAKKIIDSMVADINWSL